MFNIKSKISKYIFILFFLITFNSNALDEFDYNLLAEKLNRLEQELSDIQKSLYAPVDNTSVKEGKNPLPSKYQRRINKLENDFTKM